MNEEKKWRLVRRKRERNEEKKTLEIKESEKNQLKKKFRK